MKIFAYAMGSIVGLPLFLASPVCAQVLYEFGATPADGTNPESAVLSDTAGILYGTTQEGGVSGAGTVYSLAPPAAGMSRWTEQIVHSFGSGSVDGRVPKGDLLLSGGILYGATSGGGTGGRGALYALAPPAVPGGVWAETLLYGFSGADGSAPNGGLIADASGALYGTTAAGGALGEGEVFKLVPPAAGLSAWTLQILYSFPAGGTDAEAPAGGVAMDRHGNLFGVTPVGGGSCGCGAVYEVSPPAAGATAWTESVLHGFSFGPGGSTPEARPVIDASGVLYGTAESRGASQGGTVFSLAPPAVAGGVWGYQVLHSFSGTPDGFTPVAGLVQDARGNLYGTTLNGGTVLAGCTIGCGTLFQLKRPAGGTGTWIERTYAPSMVQAGVQPDAAVLMGAAGAFYATMSSGGRVAAGADGGGTVFKITP